MPPSDTHKPLAAAIQGKSAETARMTAKADGALAELMLALAFENDVKVRQDPALMDILKLLDDDSPIPTDALSIVADILARVYEASQQSPRQHSEEA